MPMSATLGGADLLVAIPPILMTANIVLPDTTIISLADARIAGSIDPTYGTVDWLPRLDDGPFAIITGGKQKIRQVEVSRNRVDFNIDIFLAMCEADTPGVTVNFNDRANRWLDVMQELVIPPNRRLYPASSLGWPTNGDVIWEQLGGDIKERQDVLGIAYYGAVVNTVIHYTSIVNFQG